MGTVLEPSASARNTRFPGIALVLQGGGARAAYQVGVLKALSEILGHPKENPFPIITGTSAGAINAAVLAANADNFGVAVARLVKVWEEFRPDQVYRTDFPRVARNSLRWLEAFFFGAVVQNRRVSLFDNTPLLTLIAEQAELKNIAKHLESGALRAVAVTASGYSSGQNCVFFQAVPEVSGWRRSQRVGIRVSQLRAEHLMASSAIPFAFPAIKINREYFGDGSIRQMAPMSPALHLGAARIFVIGTAVLVKQMPNRVADARYPSLAQIAGHAMSSIFLDTLAADLELLQNMNTMIGAVDAEKLKSAGAKMHHVDVCVACPQSPLEALAHQHVRDLPWAIRLLMRSIGALRKGGAALASYLLFDKRYCRALITRGYQDTIVRRDEMLIFFDPNSNPVPTQIPMPHFDPGRTLQTEEARDG